MNRKEVELKKQKCARWQTKEERMIWNGNERSNERAKQTKNM